MARPNSKYFASVITKLIAAKRKENIVIDESFKMQLRSDLLTKAAGPLPETPRPLDIGEFFAKWKYALAAVPSALVVMLIAVQFLNMPVSIPSEQIVETRTQTEEQVESVDVLDTQVEDEEIGDTEVRTDEVSAPTAKKLKLRTFPGALVMPQQLSDEGQTSSLTLPSEEVSNPNETGTPEVTPVVETPTSSAQPFNFFGLFPDTQTNEDNNDTTEAHREERFTTEDDRSPSNPVNDDPAEVQMDDGPVISEPVQQIAPVVHVGGNEPIEDGAMLLTDNEVNPPVEDTTPSEAETPEAPANEVEDPVRSITGGSLELSEPIAAEALVLAAPTVNYALNLPNYQRDILEVRVVPALAGGREVDHVYVSEKEGDIVTVEVIFEDGNKVLKHYVFNESTQVWDKVTYVTNTGYDNSLKYSTDFVYHLSY